jgi:RNA polymerase sigma-70 factor (ECF subfamily)
MNMRSLADCPNGRLESGSRTEQQAHPPGADTSDHMLIRAISRGDRHAMALLYRRHHVRVYRFASRIIGDAAAAEDIVSEVFLEVWRRADRFEAKACVSTWLLAIARNKSLSVVRRRSVELVDCEAIEVGDSADDPEVAILKRDRAKVLRSCLSRLSAAQREIIDLVYYHERSVAEVAEIIGAPANTVKTRMFYARQRMAVLLEAAGYEGL